MPFVPLSSKISWRLGFCALVMSLLALGVVALLFHLVSMHNKQDMIYSKAERVRSSSNEDRHQCLRNHFRCNSSRTCLDFKRRCDGIVDCPGAEDELQCMCAFRMPSVKFCDKYPDCFDQSDEKYCSYCPPKSFNCGDGKCVARNLVCDGRPDCENFMDENFCFKLTSNSPFASVEGETKPPKTGFLMRNLRGVWYPVCANPYDAMQDALASHACVSITANPLAATTYHQRHFKKHLRTQESGFIYHYYGRFVQWNGCLTDQGIFVTCNDVLCGFNPSLMLQRPMQARIVGGNVSRPGAWPWHGAVYKNGTYACGASLINNRWLLSAAHCFISYHRNYYEVQLGMLRRRSFTPHQKVYRIAHIVRHKKFSIITMEYDIALVKTAETVTFDFWVRPICLPNPKKIENSGSICTAIGWGDTGEKDEEEDSDDLQEVRIPLTSSCRRSNRWLCAGFPEGGRDACQGDSGGPLMCLKEDRLSWYIAGVISAGSGCARPQSPGMYTRVAYFTLWISSVLDSNDYGEQPLSVCPGWRCSAVGGGSCLPPKKLCDGHVDCYDAQDEVDCKHGRKTMPG